MIRKLTRERVTVVCVLCKGTGTLRLKAYPKRSHGDLGLITCPCVSGEPVAEAGRHAAAEL